MMGWWGLGIQTAFRKHPHVLSLCGNYSWLPCKPLLNAVDSTSYVFGPIVGRVPSCRAGPPNGAFIRVLVAKKLHPGSLFSSLVHFQSIIRKTFLRLKCALHHFPSSISSSNPTHPCLLTFKVMTSLLITVAYICLCIPKYVSATCSVHIVLLVCMILGLAV